MFEQEVDVLTKYCCKLDYVSDLAAVKECLELVVLYLRAGFYDLVCLHIDFLAALRDEIVNSNEVAEAVNSVIIGVSPYNN